MVGTSNRAVRPDAPYRPLRVYWITRWRLMWAARVDRRAGVPLGKSASTTPVLRALVARYEEVCDRERARYLIDTEPLRVRLATLAADVPTLERLVHERTEAANRAATAPSDAELVRRGAGEEFLPEALIRQRRWAEHRRAAESADTARMDAQRRLDQTISEQASLQAQLDQRFAVARSRARRYRQYTQRLGEIYRRALTRRHPQRTDLVTTWDSDFCPPPAWVSTDDVVCPRPVGVSA